MARERQAPRPAPLRRVPDESLRDDPLAGLLARAVQRRAAGAPRMLQRAVIAIDGPTDGKTARKVTRNCFRNLTTTRNRGAAAGPARVDRITPPKLGRTDSLYILGHGNPKKIADLRPAELGAEILGWYGHRRFRGKIKLVACSSAVVPSGIGAASYADRLRTYLTNNATTTFRPTSVDGVLGVAWVHEEGGKILAIDDAEYDAQELAGEDVEGAFAERRPGVRKKKITRLFGAPDMPGSHVHTGKPGAKVRYYTNLPKNAPGTGFSLWAALKSLVTTTP